MCPPHHCSSFSPLPLPAFRVHKRPHKNTSKKTDSRASAITLLFFRDTFASSIHPHHLYTHPPLLQRPEQGLAICPRGQHLGRLRHGETGQDLVSMSSSQYPDLLAVEAMHPR